MAAKKHDFTITEIKAGLFVLLVAGTLFLFLAVVNGMRLPQQTHRFYARFSDTFGLNKGGDVRFGGAKVGRVTAVKLDPDNQAQILIQADIAAEVPVNAKSEAFITQTSLTSEMHLEITTGTKEAPLLADGAEVPSTQGGLFNQAGQVAEGVSKVLADFRDLVGVQEARSKESSGGPKVVTVTELIGNVDKAINNGSDFVGELKGVVSGNKDQVAAAIKRIGEIETSANSLVDDLRVILSENRKDVRGVTESTHALVEKMHPVVEKIDKVSSQLDGIVAAVQVTMENAKTLTGEGRKAFEDYRPELENMLLDLSETARYLRDFSRTVAEQPQVLLRGKNAEGRKPTK